MGPLTLQRKFQQNTFYTALSFSRGSCQSRDQAWVSRLAGRFFIIEATREAFYTTQIFIIFWVMTCFPGGSVGKESACKVWDPGTISRLGRFPREGNSYPFGQILKQCTKFSDEQYTICERSNFSYNPQISFSIYNMSSTVLDSDGTKMIHIYARVFDQKSKIWLPQGPTHTASPTQRIGQLFYFYKVL